MLGGVAIGDELSQRCRHGRGVDAGGLLDAAERDRSREQTVCQRGRKRLEGSYGKPKEGFKPCGRRGIAHQTIPVKNSAPRPSTVGTTSERSR